MTINFQALKIFYVEFGNPDPSGYATYNESNCKPLHVMAKDYAEAAQTALEYAKTVGYESNVTTYDGSLRDLVKHEIKIKSVRCICDEVVW
jgi:hypothetical protein